MAHCDVVIENYRADVLDQLEPRLRRAASARPDIILVSMAAFGKSGGDRELVGFGPVIELMSGLASLTGYEGSDEPFKTGISYGDPVAGAYAASTVALALLKRHRTGQGSYIDLAQREGGRGPGRRSVRGGVTPRRTSPCTGATARTAGHRRGLIGVPVTSSGSWSPSSTTRNGAPVARC